MTAKLQIMWLAMVLSCALAAAAQAQEHQLALNPVVTAETIDKTICIGGYTTHLRPGSDFVSDMKDKLGRERGLGPEIAGAMILDHVVPLCLGGPPADPSNLQLQDLAESKRKDRIELKLCCLVCSGQLPLAEAQAAIAEDWRAAYHRFAVVKCHRHKWQNADPLTR
jgi:cytochrome c-type biogenesis protein CcmH/NrfF